MEAHCWFDRILMAKELDSNDKSNLSIKQHREYLDNYLIYKYIKLFYYQRKIIIKKLKNV